MVSKFPIGVMYWVGRNDGTFEVLDGQQRIISICRYVTQTTHSVRLPTPDGNYREFNYPMLTEAQRDAFLNYELQVYFCTGNDEEKMNWFQTINTAGEPLTKQEIRNAVYSSAWLTDAKSVLSKRNCAAQRNYGKYFKGRCLRQDYLEKVLEWAADVDSIKSQDPVSTYMQRHSGEKDANELWNYSEQVFDWVRTIFGRESRKEMSGVEWGLFYNNHHQDKLSPSDIQQLVDKLMMDDEVQSKKGIYEYVLDGKEKTLNLRSFSDSQKRTQYEKQNGVCPICKKHFSISEMEGDHIIPWTRGGKTLPNNIQMLCKHDNASKGGN
jgi:hypothetical protein